MILIKFSTKDPNKTYWSITHSPKISVLKLSVKNQKITMELLLNTYFHKITFTDFIKIVG